MNPLTQTELDTALGDLPDWESDNDKLVKRFKFKSFRDSVSFLVRAAFEAEEMNHHPEIENVYNQVRIRLCTHDAGSKITEKDVKLAKRIEAVANGS